MASAAPLVIAVQRGSPAPPVPTAPDSSWQLLRDHRTDEVAGGLAHPVALQRNEIGHREQAPLVLQSPRAVRGRGIDGFLRDDGPFEMAKRASMVMS